METKKKIKEKSKFYVYGLKDLDNPDVTCISGLAGIIFEGYFVWFSEKRIIDGPNNWWRFGCGIRLTETSHTVAHGRGYSREEAFERALIDLELHLPPSKYNNVWRVVKDLQIPFRDNYLGSWNII